MSWSGFNLRQACTWTSKTRFFLGGRGWLLFVLAFFPLFSVAAKPALSLNFALDGSFLLLLLLHSSTPLLLIGSWSRTVSCPCPGVDGFASTFPAAALDLCLYPRAELFHIPPQEQRQFVSIPAHGEWSFACGVKVEDLFFLHMKEDMGKQANLLPHPRLHSHQALPAPLCY